MDAAKRPVALRTAVTTAPPTNSTIPNSADATATTTETDDATRHALCVLPVARRLAIGGTSAAVSAPVATRLKTRSGKRKAA